MIFLLFASLLFAAESPIQLKPKKVVQGGVLQVQIQADAAPSSVKWKSQEVVPFQNPANKKQWIAYFAIPFDTTPGKEEVVYLENKFEFTVVDAKFRKETLKVEPGKVSPSPEDLKRMNEERDEVRAIYASQEIAPMWKGKFKRPLNSEIRSQYGTKRLFNGELTSHHNGVDFRAATGTKIKAANDGRVRLAKDLFMAGNMVLVEHGGGIYTIYAHLSRIDVKTGDEIKKDQVLGLSGATGRVNGPHLHWGMKIHGEEGNPLELLKIQAFK